MKSNISGAHVPYVIAALVVFCYTTSVGQHKEPVPKDDTIIMTSTLSGDSLFTDIGQRLVKAGFTLAATNKEFGQISTAPKVFRNHAFSYSLMILIDGHNAEIKPTFVTDSVLHTYRWFYRKQKTSKNYVVMMDILKALEGVGDVSYEKKG